MKLFDLSGRRNRENSYPLIPLKEQVLFPHVVAPVFLAKKQTLAAARAAEDGSRVFLVLQRQDATEHSSDTLYEVGVLGSILQTMKLPDGTLRVLIEGKERARLRRCVNGEEYQNAVVERLHVPEAVPENHTQRVRVVKEAFERYGQSHKKIPSEVTSQVERAEDPQKVVDLISAHVPFSFQKKLELLAETDPGRRLEELAVALEGELELVDLKKNINSRVKDRIEKTQKDYFLKEQMKEIQKELGGEDDDPRGAKELERRISEKAMPAYVREKAEKELRRLAKLQPVSPEAGIVRTYLDWILELPWYERSDDVTGIDRAQQILDEDHYDMARPKERMIEYIAVRQLTEELKGPILCFVGPPGTGKTSLGQSLARALGREFIRISLGGVRDEAEIRGHRRTYVGALPGKIIQSLRKAGTKNPVFLLDEVDKMNADFRGDPASALLEVLDPEQNATFVDHYLELQFDLSDVIFITTANTLHTIPHALQDRMEVLEIPGYTEFEKQEIAKGFIIPKQLSRNGLDWADVRFRSDSIREIIRNYTMESGVRNLEREIANVVRKVAVQAVQSGFRPPEPIPAGHDESGPETESAAADQDDPANTGGGSPEEDAGGGSGHDGADKESGDGSGTTGTGSEDNSGEGGAVAADTGGSSRLLGGSGAPSGDAEQSSQRESAERAAASEAERGEAASNPAQTLQSGEMPDAVPETGEDPQRHTEIPHPVAKDIHLRTPFKRVITAATVRKSLGKRKFKQSFTNTENRPGLCYGLAWTELGGRLLPVEATVFDGRGELILTGSLGDVMKESAKAALSFIRTYRSKFGLSEGFASAHDIHIHVPEGAIPKDGPSAGVTLVSAILSAFSHIAPRPNVAMTGEITLTGRVLSVGGIKEKVLAAHRNKIDTVLLPEGNREDTEELPSEVRSAVNFVFAGGILDAMGVIFPEDLFQMRPY